MPPMPVTFFIFVLSFELLVMIDVKAKPKQNDVARRAKIIANAHIGGPACLSDEDVSILLPFNRLIKPERQNCTQLVQALRRAVCGATKRQMLLAPNGMERAQLISFTKK
jgi:hypothetical protein